MIQPRVRFNTGTGEYLVSDKYGREYGGSRDAETANRIAERVKSNSMTKLDRDIQREWGGH